MFNLYTSKVIKQKAKVCFKLAAVGYGLTLLSSKRRFTGHREQNSFLLTLLNCTLFIYTL